jgi:hypothetical protein
MNQEKLWARYTQVGDIFVNITTYKRNLVPDGDCLVWTGPLHRQGYGFIGYLTETGLRKMTVAHRVAMRLKLNRGLATKEDVRHTCNKNHCCNPDHLYIKTNETINETTETIPAFAQ